MTIDRISEWGEATFHEPASDGELRTAEETLGHALPVELRALLSQSNGIDGDYSLGLLWNADRIAADNRTFRDSDEFAELYMPFDGLVFFADAGNGDQFGISLSGNHEVFCWDHESDSRAWVASSVIEYLERWMTGTLKI